jgi:hypothetical protein
MAVQKNPKVYLDNCCYNRPYDDQSQLRVEIETKAKLSIQEQITNGQLDLVISFMSEIENSDNPFEERKRSISGFFSYSGLNIRPSDALKLLTNEIVEKGLKPEDATHVAASILAGCDYLFTTDDRILKYTDDRIRIMNPTDFIIEREVEDDE